MDPAKVGLRLLGQLDMPEHHSELSEEQHVMLYPTFVYYDDTAGTWRVPITGFVYQGGRDNMRQRMFLRLLQQVLKIDEAVLKTSEIFEYRIRGFLHVPQKMKPIVFHVGENRLAATGQTKGSGHVRCTVALGADDIPQQLAHTTSVCGGPIEHRIRCRVALAPGDQRLFENELNFIPPRGVSVISDIDDTIKISQVAHRNQLLHNTFLNPFVTVPGMARLYQNWKSAGAAFHYVSSSPWQLFEPLDNLLASSGFPKGSFHLRYYRFGDPSVLRLFMSRKRNKYNTIKSIFRMFPRRRFILIGDSGEKDPEIYGKIARKFPGQIRRIFIRRVDGRPWTRQRASKAFKMIPRELWQTFRVPTQIRELDFTEFH